MKLPTNQQPLKASCSGSTRRIFLGTMGICCLSFVAAPIYARKIEPEWLQTNSWKVPLPGIPHGTSIKLLHISDLHSGEYVRPQFIERAIRTGLELKPDIVCLTGDYVNAQDGRLEALQSALKLLSAAAPTYATLGNHDGGSWAVRWGGYSDVSEVSSVLEKAGIKLLVNQTAVCRTDRWKLNLAGFGDLWAGMCHPQQAFAGANLDADAPIIALSHNPDTKELLREYDWHLMLCGHTHGGQFSLPLIGQPFAPVRDRRFVMGLHRWDNRWIFITKGVGNLHGLRFNCRPEVSLLHLTPLTKP